MQNNKLIIAAAGSGKTRTIVHEALEIRNANVLITTFTEANEEEIKKRIIKETGGYIPANITIQTWFSFLMQHGVRPFQGVMSGELWDKKIGFYLISGSSSIYKGKGGGIFSKNKERDFFEYYFISKNNLKMYSDKVAEFVYDCDKKIDGDIFKRISKIYPNIFIDEVQDLAGYDLEILKKLFETQSNIVMVGDPRQGTYSTHNSRKNKKFTKSEIVHFFDDEDIKKNLIIDDKSLTINYRCNEDICNLSNRLFSNLPIVSSGQTEITNHDGVFYIDISEVDSYLNSYPECVQLRWDIRTKTHNRFKVMNFGESKGLSFDRVLIYPTATIINWLKDNNAELSPTTRCKLYVAITRARYSVAIVIY